MLPERPPRLHTPGIVRGLAVCAGVLALFAACGSGNSPAAPSASATGAPVTTGGVAGCEITAASDASPLTGDPKSPYYDAIGLARSADGALAAGYGEALAHASAPDATRLPGGGVGVYYHNGETGGAIWLARLEGSALSPVAAITVDGVVRPRWMADPNVDLIDGRVRMTYLNGEGLRRFCIAESGDGIAFTTRALAIRFSGTEADPTVARLSDGSWLMAYSRENHSSIGFARSGDGLSFTAFATAGFGVVPELAVLPDGRVRLYVCASGNVDAYLSADRGTTWQREATVITNQTTGRTIVCDPSYLPSDGLFVFKVTDAR